MFPWMMFPVFLAPKMPTDNDKPPTLYALLNSMVNYYRDEDQQIKIKDLTKQGRKNIFNFDYPLSDKIDKEQFEINILNHFLMRRIGYETFTSWQIALNSKLNEIMPMYNKIFDSFEDWNLFNSGEEITRTTNTINTDSTTGTNSVETTTENDSTTTNDRRYSDTPQNNISDVKNGNYITEYEFNTEKNDSETTTNTSGSNETSSNGTQETEESISRTPIDKINIYKQYLENLQSVYTMIYKDLDSLFYQLV